MPSEEYLNIIERLYREHHQRLLAYSYSLCRDRQQAEDIVQECFYVLCKAEKDAHQWLPYIRSCIRHFFYKEHEKKRRFQLKTLDQAQHLAVDIEDTFKRETITKILALLKKEYSEVLVLSYEGYSTEEIKKQMNLGTENAVFQKRKRARSQAREIREQQGFKSDF